MILRASNQKVIRLLLGGAAYLIVRWPWAVLLSAIALTAALAPGLAAIQLETGQENLLPSGSQVLSENEGYQEQFGGQTMQLLFTGDRDDILAPDNLQRMQELEDALRSDPRYFAVYSPATYLQVAADQTVARLDDFNRALAEAQDAARTEVAAAGGSPEEQEAAAGAAGGAVIQDFLARHGEEAEQFAGISDFSLGNPDFVAAVLYEADGTLRPQFAALLPDDTHALLVSRIDGNLSLEEAADTGDDFVALTEGYDFRAVDTLPTGSPMLIGEISESMTGGLYRTGIIAAAIMAVVLGLAFRAHWRLLSLPVMAIGVIWSFGLMGYLGIPLTIATVAGLPIMIGLGADFAIQFHNRYNERMRADEASPRVMAGSLKTIGPGVFLAMLVTVLGFAALLISDVPVIRDFSVIHGIGVVLVFFAGLFVLNSILVLRDRRREPEVRRRHAGRDVSLFDGALGWVSRAAAEHPVLLTAFALAFFALGVYYDGEIPVETDPEGYLPGESGVLTNLDHLRDVVGSTGEIGVMVEADDVLDPALLRWMMEFEDSQVEGHGNLIKSANSPASTVAQLNGGTIPDDRAVIEESLSTLPPEILRTLVSEDGRRANVLFVTANIPLLDVKEVIDQTRSEAAPPPGVSIGLGGLTVIGAEAVTSLDDGRRLMTFAALAGILLVLALLYWNPVKAALTLVPIALVVGWASGVMYLAGISLNPLTAVLGALIAGIGTEFTVLLRRQYEEEKAAGLEPAAAMHRAVLKIGRAICASAFTVMGGFGALALSDFPLLRDFGVATVINLFLALLATLLFFPAIAVWVDDRLVGRARVPGEQAAEQQSGAGPGA